METGRVALSRNGKTTQGFRLDSKVALITGAGSGIGRALAQKFASYGALVHILDLDEELAKKTAEEIKAAGGQAGWQRCDVSDQKQVKSVFDAIIGKGPVDILINNAGIAHIGNLENT